MGFSDLREHLDYLEKNGMLIRVKKEVDRDWEIAAFCRQVFRKKGAADRPAILFEKVKGFDIPVVAGAIGGSHKIYATSLNIPYKNMIRNVGKKWADSINNPIEPVIVETGHCKENILTGEEIDLFKFPHPFWTKGQDPGYFLTAPCVISKHPETGVRNMGCYRCQIKGKDTTGIHITGGFRHISPHWVANNKLGKPTPIAIVIGADPTIPLTAVSGVPVGVDELGVAGAIRGSAVEMVKCETIDLEVPANAEIVIEGEILPDYLEEEGPFGEYTGQIGAAGPSQVVKVKCITHRNNPIYHCYVSQMPPSESSLMRSFGRESGLYSHLRDRLALPVKDVHLTEAGGAAYYLAISVERTYPGQFWQFVWGAWSQDPSLGKWTVIVDDDIDIRDPFQLQWALSLRVRPDKDIYIIENSVAVALDPALAPPLVSKGDPRRKVGSKILIDATKKHEYSAKALPPQEDMDKVEAMWKEYGLDW